MSSWENESYCFQIRAVHIQVNTVTLFFFFHTLLSLSIFKVFDSVYFNSDFSHFSQFRNRQNFEIFEEIFLYIKVKAKNKHTDIIEPEFCAFKMCIFE